jgi:hypothetical protein
MQSLVKVVGCCRKVRFGPEDFDQLIAMKAVRRSQDQQFNQVAPPARFPLRFRDGQTID